MPRKTSTGIRKPLSPEARQRISEAVKAAADKKREEVFGNRLEKTPRKVLVIDQFNEPPTPHQKQNQIISKMDQENGRQRRFEIVKMSDQRFSENLFDAMETGTIIDPFFSTKSGIPRATNYMIVGDPGVGKSTVALDILANLHLNNFKVLFVSAEMTRIDLHEYVNRYPKFGKIPILFLGEYLDENPKGVIEEVLDEGYDVVLIDSFSEVCECVREGAGGMNGNQSEKWLIDLMIRNNLGSNINNLNTAFLCIQQVTKGGVFVGTNKLKHNTTGMLELRFDEGGNKSYMTFTKNRRGKVGPKLYFSLELSEDVRYMEQEQEKERDGAKPRSRNKKMVEPVVSKKEESWESEFNRFMDIERSEDFGPNGNSEFEF